MSRVKDIAAGAFQIKPRRSVGMVGIVYPSVIMPEFAFIRECLCGRIGISELELLIPAEVLRGLKATGHIII